MSNLKILLPKLFTRNRCSECIKYIYVKNYITVEKFSVEFHFLLLFGGRSFCGRAGGQSKAAQSFFSTRSHQLSWISPCQNNNTSSLRPIVTCWHHTPSLPLAASTVDRQTQIICKRHSDKRKK